MRIRSNQIIRKIIAAAVLCAASVLSFAQTDPLAQARSLLDAGKAKESETILRDYLSQNPSSADAHFLLGYALFREQRAKESLAELTTGAKFRQPRADELKIVAADYVMLGDFSDADKWFTQVVSQIPDDADAWYLLGRTKYNEDEFAAAISSFERALALHPRHVEAENNIGLAWKELNDSGKAKTAFLAAIEWQGNSPVDAQPFLNLGTLLADSNQVADALPYLTKATELSPQNPTVHEQLGKAYFAMNRLPEAQAELERAIALSPETATLHYKLGQILRKAGLQERARQEFAIVEKLSGAHSSSKTPNPPSSSSNGPN
jgi:tetratricopeptide (TPR) repeat protein